MNFQILNLVSIILICEYFWTYSLYAHKLFLTRIITISDKSKILPQDMSLPLGNPEL